LAKVGVCAGSAAVLATAITLPIVLTQNKGGTPVKPFSGEITADQWKIALGTSISFGDGTNFKCTIHDTFDEEHDVTIKMRDKRVQMHKWDDEIIQQYRDIYEFEDDYGYWSQRDDGDLVEPTYYYKNIISELKYYNSHLKVIYDNKNNFSNFAFDSTTKEYKVNESKNYGESKLTLVKFKDEKHIEKAVVSTAWSSIATYTFEYGNTSIDSFVTPTNIHELNYNGETGTYATSHCLDNIAFPYYKVDVSKFSTFVEGTHTIKCSHPEIQGSFSETESGVYVDKVKVDEAGYDTSKHEFTGIGTITATSKLILYVGDENGPDATQGFQAEVVNTK